MAYVLKNKAGLFLKSIDFTTPDITFTNNLSDAKVYNGGEWFADTELEFVKFHFKDRPEVQTLRTVYE